ncbi:MAG: sigma-70 family RNA polymerase sigma factor [Verrucomicrobiales bacterium]|nr:sigma-70 family RNA polymerase sigma factor [Verrucomicrobiales bacterium]
MMPENNPDSEDASFSDLMAGHQGRLIGYIRTMIPDIDAAKDVLQETNMTLLRKSRDFEPGSNFTAWAFRIAYFEVLAWRRNKGRDRLQFSNELVESLAQTGERVSDSYDSRLDALKTCLEKLPERQKTIVQRHYLNGAPVQDIAREMDVKANAASQLLHRARHNLFQCINKLTGGAK